MKKMMVFICYLLASLNNTKINSFKFDVAYYLDSAGTSNEGLNTMANLGVTTTARAVDRRKKKMSDMDGEYVDDVLSQHAENALVLNVDDYHNIHVQRRPDVTSTSWAAHMATILAMPCPMPAISCTGVVNPKIVDSELIIRHLDERFIVNLGVSYNDHLQRRERSDDEIIEGLTLHSYNDRLIEKQNDRHIQNSTLIDFVRTCKNFIFGIVNQLRIKFYII